MNEPDTTLGGSARNFPATTWDMLVRVRDPGGRDYRSGLEELCGRYWKPIYHYFRIARRKQNEEAKDLAQGFFLWLVQGDALRKYEPSRGGFRTFLKVLLRHYAWNEEVAADAQKRGGNVRIAPIDPSIPVEAREAEEVFDEAWTRELTRNAIERVREKLSAAGRQSQFRVFEEYDLAAGAESPSYSDVGRRLGITPEKVRDNLFAVRKAMREEIRKELERLTTDGAELEEEWNSLFGRREPGREKRK